jgi:hypothetical protein
MMAGMVALVSSAVQLFRTSKDLGAVTDSARRSLASMARVLRLALHFDNSNCTVDKVTFWCDVDNDQSNAADVDNYALAERVQLMRYGTEAKINVTEPGATPVETGASTPRLGSYVSSLKFYYFQHGPVPSADPFTPTGTYTGSDINGEVAVVRIVMTFRKGSTTRRFYQDVFLRIIIRSG